MIIQHREPTDGDGKDFRKFFQPAIDPFFAVARSFPEQEGASDTACDAVVPAGYGYIDKVGASHRHGGELRPFLSFLFVLVSCR